MPTGLSESYGGKVTVYDISGIPETLRQQIVKLYTPLFKGVNKVLTLNYLCSQTQEGGADCGLFAIANCLALANKMDPMKMNFSQDKMRSHLIRCIENEKFEIFPFSDLEQKNKTKINKVCLTMFCICHLYSKEAMIV